jgi:hypothetical protein
MWIGILESMAGHVIATRRTFKGLGDAPELDRRTLAGEKGDSETVIE